MRVFRVNQGSEELDEERGIWLREVQEPPKGVIVTASILFQLSFFHCVSRPACYSKTSLLFRAQHQLGSQKTLGLILHSLAPCVVAYTCARGV